MNTAGQKKILVADNDEDVLISIERELESAGYSTTTVVSRAELLKMLDRDEFDLLVLDDYLSDADSVEVMKSFERKTDVPLVVVTCNRDLDRNKVDELRAMGVSAFVRKCAHQELADIIGYLLRPLPSLYRSQFGIST